MESPLCKAIRECVQSIPMPESVLIEKLIAIAEEYGLERYDLGYGQGFNDGTGEGYLHGQADMAINYAMAKGNDE